MSWDSNLAAVDAAVAGYFDTQLFTAIGMRKPARDVNGLAEPDPSRPPFDFNGTIELEPSMQALSGSANSNARNQAERHGAKLCLSALATLWPWMPKQGDVIAAGGLRYTLSAAPDRDGTDRLVLWLNTNRAGI